MQIVGILIAAAWGVYTFIHKEITTPKSAPVNISINLQLKKVGTGSSAKANLTAVQLDVSATNPSSREIQLFPSAWIARGIHVTAANTNETDLAKATNAALQNPTEIYTVGRHATEGIGSLVAAGLLFVDQSLKPNEKIARTIIFYVPKDEYDLIKVGVAMASAEDVSRTRLVWSLSEDHTDFERVFYRLNKNGEGSPINESDAYLAKRLKLQWSEADSDISLWP